MVPARIRALRTVPTLRQTALFLLRWTIVGLAGALALNRLFASLLFGVGPTDPGTLAAVASAIAIVAAVACGLPAWRASRLDPNVVLRGD